MQLGKLSKHSIITIAMLVALSIAIVGGVIGVSAYMREPYIVRQEVIRRYSKVSRYSIDFYMKPNNIYDGGVVSAERGLPIYLNLVEGINISYIYRVENARASGTVKTTVFLKHPDGWGKRYLETMANFTDMAASSIYINVSDVTTLMDGLCRQIGARLSSFNIVIATDIDYTLSTGVVRRDFYNHSVTLVVDQVRNRVTLDGALLQTVPVEEKRDVYIRQSVLGVDVESLRIASVSMASIGAVATAILSIARTRLTVKNPLEEFEARYRDIIISASSVPISSGSRSVYVSEPSELVKVARLLEKPIIRYGDGGSQPMYMVIDRDAVYILGTGGGHSKANT